MGHPNIIDIYEVFEDPNNLYVVMEHCSGGDGDAYDKIKYKPENAIDLNLTEEELQEQAMVIYQMIESVAYIHSMDIVHWDIKLDNFMFKDRGLVKLIDFGLAEINRWNEYNLSELGTPNYMA